MKVRTQSEKLGDLRRGVMELYISDHPLDCLTCPTNGNCELQDMAGVVGLREVRYNDGAGTARRSPRTRIWPRTNRIRTSRTTRPSASSATAACAPARRRRARSR
jgi:NADH dehydrogenase/NADH:ubiquinone oxidoreductase subunit G